MNYVPSNHYKIGMHNVLFLKSFEDHVDNDTDSWFIARYKESLVDIKKRLKHALRPKRQRNKH